MAVADITRIQQGGEDGSLSVLSDERTARLREQIMARKGSFVANAHPFLRDAALWRAMRPGMSMVQVRAELLLALVRQAPLEFPPDWTLAGEHLANHGFAFDDPFQPNQEPDRSRLAELGLTPAECEAVEAAVARYGAMRQARYAVGEYEPEMAMPVETGVGGGWVENHSIRDFAKVLRLGFAGIAEEVRAARGALAPSAPGYPQADSFWRAALAVCEAGCVLGRRYAEAAREQAEAATAPQERARFENMAALCERVPAQPARTFAEAVQSLWLAHILTCGEDGINANSIGRLDQILQPYYEADRAAGRAGRGDAVALMEELACKLYLDYDVQAIVLGGLDAQGHDAVNDMSFIILEASRNVGFVRDLSVRLSSKTRPDFVEAAAEVISRGGGVPFIFNDDCFVPALTDHGVALQDARDYAPIGCIELTIPGRANPHAVSGWFNAAKCLELALFDGRDPRTGKQLGPRTGPLSDHNDFESLYAAYQAQVAFFAERMAYNINRGELAQREGGPLPCWSVLTDDCIARGRDITDGGAVYNYHSVCFLGAANVADSLCAVKELVYDADSVEPEALMDALANDFVDGEELRQRLLKGAPKYGNDIAEVDDLAARVCNDFIDLMDAYESPLGGPYVVHLFTFLNNLMFGRHTGATPDGRRAGETLAYSLSAHQGRDREGVTAMLSSLARLPHNRAAGASAAIIDLDPKLIAGRAGVKRLAQTITAAMALGVGQLQFNVTTAERLLQAQRDPERYGNIPVRVAGYSQKFNLLTEELQNHVIARTKHGR